MLDGGAGQFIIGARCCQVDVGDEERSGAVASTCRRSMGSWAARHGTVRHHQGCGPRLHARARGGGVGPRHPRQRCVPGGTIKPYHIRRAAERGVTEEELRRSRAGDNLLGRWAKPREVACAILFLACPESSFITGATLMVDGGRSIL
jgi:Enoyl-(Acyl carrier protein) reductase